MREIKKLLKNKTDCDKLAEVSSGGVITIWILPDNTYIVPSLTDLCHESPVEFLHISDKKCSLSKCKVGK